MPLYRKRPVTVEAIQWTGDHAALTAFGVPWAETAIPTVVVVWNEAEHQWIRCPQHHWIIRGVAGEYDPCDPTIFAVTYELATADSNLNTK